MGIINKVTRHMKLPQYSGKDYIIMIWTLIPFDIILNSIILGRRYFREGSLFVYATLLMFLLLTIAFILYGAIAVAFRNRFPSEQEFLKRNIIVIGLFIIMTGLNIFLFFKIYESIPALDFTFADGNFTGAYAATVILNIFLTFLHEGVSRFAKYRETLIETEQLKKEYLQSQLLGLKSQVNPHFLFNGLNSLSSLISDNPEEAEKFLDEMSKVYRYLLRNDEEKLVTLETELRFIRSYYYLLRARYGEGVQLEIDVTESLMNMLLPPLTLQMLFENAFNLNSLSKDQPLRISIRSKEKGWLTFINNIQVKLGQEDSTGNEGLENVINKYRLLCQQSVSIEQQQQQRIIRLPLITREELVAV